MSETLISQDPMDQFTVTDPNEVRLWYKPLDIHVGFHETAASEKLLLGAVGSGKTIALCADAISFGMKYPGCRILIARQTIPALKVTTEYETYNLLASKPDGVYESLWDHCDHRKTSGHFDYIMLPNGSILYFRALDEWTKHMGLNLSRVYIDEANEISEDAYHGLGTRTRQVQPTNQAVEIAREQGYKLQPIPQIARGMALASNPNGRNWIWHHFINPDTLAGVNKENKLPVRRAFRSTSFDNKWLPEDFLDQLMRMPPRWVKRFVLCLDEEFSGMIYDFNQSHMVPYFEPPPNWERAMGFDPGLRNPAAMVWWARDPRTNTWYAYREWQSYDQADQKAKDLAETPTTDLFIKTIKNLETDEEITLRAADPTISNKQANDGKSIRYHMEMSGINFELGSRDYMSRIQALGKMLDTGELKIMTSCPIFGRQLEQYKWAERASTKIITDEPEKPHKYDDHIVDAAQYLSTQFYKKTKPKKPKRKHLTTREELAHAASKRINDRKKKLRRRRGRVMV